MVNLCPNEADPRENISEFVSNPDAEMIPGNRSGGIEELMSVLMEELKVQEPESETVVLDRESLADDGITFPRELEAFLLNRSASGRKINVLVMDDLPVVGWQKALEVLRGRDAQVYIAGRSCKYVPVCSKYFTLV